MPRKRRNGDVPFTSQTYTKAGEETELHIAISEEDWDKAKQAKDEASAEDPRKVDQLVHEAEEFLKRF